MKHLEENEVMIKNGEDWSDAINLPNINSIGDLKRANRVLDRLKTKEERESSKEEQKSGPVDSMLNLFRPELERRVFYCLRRYFPDDYDWDARLDFSDYLKSTHNVSVACKMSYKRGFKDPSDMKEADKLFEDLYLDVMDIVGHNSGRGEVLFPIFFKNVSMIPSESGRKGDLFYPNSKGQAIDVKYGETTSFGWTKPEELELPDAQRAVLQIIRILSKGTELLFFGPKYTRTKFFGLEKKGYLDKIKSYPGACARYLGSVDLGFRKKNESNIAIWLNESQEPDAKLCIGDQNMNTTKGFRMRRMNENFNKDNWCAPSVSELARDLEEAVKYLWEHRDEGGCYHWPIYYEENGQEWDVVLGWQGGFDDDPNIYFDNDWAICASVRYQTAHNAMQTDMDMDFLMPYPINEYGDVWDADVTVSREEDFNALAKDLLDEGKKMVEMFADKDVEEDEEDIEESRKLRGHTLRESKHFSRHGRMLKESNANYERSKKDYVCDVVDGMTEDEFMNFVGSELMNILYVDWLYDLDDEDVIDELYEKAKKFARR